MYAPTLSLQARERREWRAHTLPLSVRMARERVCGDFHKHTTPPTGPTLQSEAALSSLLGTILVCPSEENKPVLEGLLRV